MTVGFMLELLQPQAGDKVLDVGAGSGWTAALLARIVGPSGHVYAIERIPQLKMYGEGNLRRAGVTGVEIHSGNGAKGLQQFAPFDRIHVAAAAESIPAPLVDQLALGGRLVMPVGEYVQDIVVLERIGKSEVHEERYPGFQFVPLVADAV
jgi:protein-L-isoaspartate(D-aspartate) O-methyltransferase